MRKRSVLTLGTFDGVHLGHQAIIRQVVQRAREQRARSVALSFDMPPRFKKPDRTEPVLLTTWKEKTTILRALGIDRVLPLTFNKRTASTPAEKFFERTIVKKSAALEMIVGPGIAFGKDRRGRLPLLKQLGRKYAVRIRVVRPVPYQGQMISSQRIRALLEAGDVKTAAALLGRPYSAEGRVVHGNHRGRTLGYPTANIKVPPGKILPLGVFWVKVLNDPAKNALSSAALRNSPDGLCNVGTRPTFSPRGKKVHFEVFLLKKPKSDLYRQPLTIVFMAKIRSEKRFRSAQALKAGIAKDFKRALLLIKRFSLQNRAISV